MDASVPLLSVRNLSVGFQQENQFHTALNGISFDIERGKIVAVVGESGSGKSVSSLSILQLLPPKITRYKAGDIQFSVDGVESKNLLELPESALRKIRGNDISMIFQEPMSALNPVYTCGNQVMEVIRQHKNCSHSEARHKTLQLFKQVQLPDPELAIAKFPHELSGGQKQRVMIAMAIACEPKLLIADEPTTALDVTVQKNILALLSDLQAETKMGILFITHDLGLVRDFADRIVVLYKGNIVEQGTCEEIFTKPQHPYTKALLACRPILYQKGQVLPVVDDFLTHHKTAADFAHSSTLPAPKEFLKTNAPLLQVRSLSVWFPRKKNWLGSPVDYTKAVDELSFDILPGETLGVVGESGCGKTTLGRALLQLLPITRGSVLFKGKELTTFTKQDLKKTRKDVQLVFQDPYGSLNPRLTIGEAIRETLQVHHPNQQISRQKEKVIELLERVHLHPDHYHRYPHAFSGGQRQRIGIARALALEPSFIVFDESVSALDVSVQAQVLNLINELKASFGFTALFITHDLGVVHYISDRIIVMNKGKIAEMGDTETVFNRPSSPVTQLLLNSIPGNRNWLAG